MKKSQARRAEQARQERFRRLLRPLLEPIRRALEAIQRPPENYTSPFLRSVVDVFNNPITHAFLQLIQLGPSDVSPRAPASEAAKAVRTPVHVHRGREGGSIVLSEERSDSGEPGRGGLEGLDDLTADVMLAVLAHLSSRDETRKTKHPYREPVTITATGIAKALGPRLERNGRAERVRIVTDEVRRIVMLTADLRGYEVPVRSKGRWSYEPVSRPGVPLFEIVDERRVWKLDSDRERLDDRVWTIRAGPWAEYWFNAAGKAWVCHISGKLLSRGARSRADKLPLVPVPWNVL